MNYNELEVDEKTAALERQLTAALCAEWLAYYQYWWAALVVEGIDGSSVAKHYEEHAEEEKEHIDALAKRMHQLGILPVFDPVSLSQLASCKYPKQIEHNVCNEKLLNQIIIAEECAVCTYKTLLHYLSDDPVTTDVIVKILANEEEHLSEMKRELRSVQYVHNKS